MNRGLILIGGIMLILLSMMLFVVSNNNKKKNTLDHMRVEYLRDSLEMEYYKKQLESYPFGHSKISTEDGTK